MSEKEFSQMQQRIDADVTAEDANTRALYAEHLSPEALAKANGLTLVNNEAQPRPALPEHATPGANMLGGLGTAHAVEVKPVKRIKMKS